MLFYHLVYKFLSLFAAKQILKGGFLYLLLLLMAGLYTQRSAAQYIVRGNVLDSSHKYPLSAVSVQATNGAGTATDSAGFYQLNVGAKDSVWFSYLGKPTRKFPVLKIADINQFDIALQVNIPVLPELKIRPRNYRQDSLQNREDYADIFNFHRPNLESMTSIGPNGAGIDLDELIRVFQFKKNKSTMAFRERLLQQEQDKFVDHRFNRALVRRLTGFDEATLDRFIALYRPSFDFAAAATDYQFQLYIKESAARFRAGKTAPAF